jgi:hypothetical protein
MFGYVRLEVRVWHQGQNQLSATYTEDIDATCLQTWRLRGNFLRYDGQNAGGTGTLNLPTPTLADLQFYRCIHINGRPCSINRQILMLQVLRFSTAAVWPSL